MCGKRAARASLALIACAFVMVYVAGVILTRTTSIRYTLSLEAEAEAEADLIKVILFDRPSISDVASECILKDSMSARS